ncbi:DUF4281 domain-containing protein [Dactylosporangium roseum]|uniref:DUF4281 domain-containing protein n=1 Tax=Dactylosporangium roseum TaxID=47989 RepID=A0ABY5Z117_9ACTN|nr:ABA4-like family protein [Dactylosporangium roseum]UWZ35296.1 DUF4281 domain-containing protein [Dactylosporangium roseum]
MAPALFQLAFLAAVPFWALMIFTPTWRWTHRIVSSPLIVLPALAVWAVAIGPVFGDFTAEMLSPSIDGVRTLFADDTVIAAVWAQVLAWDLFVGRWIYLDGRERRIHPLITAPVLVLTILLSPIAVPLYLLLRSARPAPAARPATQDA